MRDQDWHIIEGHALDALATLPDSSIHACITSLPYYLLRTYGSSPQVWGGERDCDHEWQQITTSPPSERCSRCSAWRGELGHDPTVDLYIAHLVELYRGVRRVLHPSGTLWIIIAPGYADRHNGPWKPRDLVPTPCLLGIALVADGWYLRGEIIWHKSNSKPESVKNRPIRDHETVLMLTREPNYYYDWFGNVERSNTRTQPPKGVSVTYTPSGFVTVRMSTLHVERTYRALRSVWSIATAKAADASHTAPFPITLVERCITLSTSPVGVCSVCQSPVERVLEPVRMASGRVERYETVDWRATCDCRAPTVPATVLDPCCGSGQTIIAALRLGRSAVGIEVEPTYAREARQRIIRDMPLLNGVSARPDSTSAADHEAALAPSQPRQLKYWLDERP